MRERTHVSGQDERCAVVEVHTNRPVREGIAHTILITVVDPRRDEDVFLRQVCIVARATEK
jgi:hypothetical protein